MRDILLLVALLGAIPIALARPLIAAAIYIFLSVGSIHKLAYGFSADFPWAAIYAGVLLISVAFSSSASFENAFKIYSRFVPLLVVVTISTLIHYDQPWSLERFIYFLKIQFAILLIMATLRSTNDVIFILGALVSSISFHAVKGSFVVLSAFTTKGIAGPPESMIADNNHYATALVFCIPIILYFALGSLKFYQRFLSWFVMIACILVAMGTWSRGGLLALVCIGVLAVLLLKQHRIKIFLIIIPVSLIILILMPEGFHERMSSISGYGSDASVQGRFAAWKVAVSIALSEPFGAGFDYYYNSGLWMLYGPENSLPRAAHSIYFQILGDHGFPGIFAFSWLLISAVISVIKPMDCSTTSFKEGFSISKAVVLSLAGVLSGGAFLSLAYWEGLHILLGCMLALGVLKAKMLESNPSHSTAVQTRLSSIGRGFFKS